MITEKELLEAIAECHGVRNPNANTCAKLASYYTILDHIADESVPTNSPPTKEAYSFSSEVEFEGDSDFSKAIRGMHVNDLIAVMDELMTTLQIINPRLYAGVMRKLEGE